MSFNIPIFFDDSPLFGDDSFFTRQPRRFVRQGRQPDVFQSWERPQFFFNDPRKEQHRRANYQNNPKPKKFMPRRNERYGDTFYKPPDEANEDEDISDQEEPSGVNAHFGDQYGWDGWNVPVQYVEEDTRGRPQKPKHGRHPNHHHRRAQGNKDEVPVDKPMAQKPVQQRNKLRNAVPCEVEKQTEETQTVDKKKEGLTEDLKKDEHNEQEPDKKGETDELPGIDKTALDSRKEKQDSDSSVEIPVQYSAPKDSPSTRKSKRFSQCDPPSPADIKLSRIKSILEKTEGLEKKIKEFNDAEQNMKYLYISETLMKVLLDLDTVDSEGLDVVRKARKQGVELVQNLVEKLENKLSENKNKQSSAQE